MISVIGKSGTFLVLSNKLISSDYWKHINQGLEGVSDDFGAHCSCNGYKYHDAIIDEESGEPRVAESAAIVAQNNKEVLQKEKAINTTKNYGTNT